MHAWKSDTDAPLLASLTPRYGNSRITVFKRLFAPNGSGTKINLSVVSTCFWARCLSDKTGGMVSLRCHRSKYIWATLGVLALLWLYIFPVYRIPSDKEMVDEVLRQGQTWSRNQTGVELYRYFHSFSITFIYSVIGRWCARPRMQNKLVLWCNFKRHFSLSSQKVGFYRYLVHAIWLSCWYKNIAEYRHLPENPIRRTRMRRWADSFETLSVPALNSQKGWPLWRHKEFDFVRGISCLVY